MKEATIWEVTKPEVGIDDMLAAQGGKKVHHKPRPAILEVNKRMLAEAAELVRPLIIWNEAKVAGADEKNLVLEEGLTLTGRLLTRVAGTADKMVIYAMTIGGALEERITEYNKAGNMSEAFCLDTAGSVFLTKSAAVAVEQIGKKYEAEGMAVSFPMGPGHSYWEGLEDVRDIVGYLQAEKIGISLTESNLMLPKKSLAFVMGVGKNLPDFKGKTHCDFCSLKNKCNMKALGEC